LTEQPPNYPRPQSAGTNRMAIASLVCSLFGWLWLIGPILGLMFGFVALNQIRQTGQRGRGMAIAGIAIGGILVAFIICMGMLRAKARHTPHMHSDAPAVMIVEPQTISPPAAA
jgi:Domain of unknown function (DUF4190)